MIVRWQLPAYSPISFAVLRRAILRGPGGGAADLVALSRLLEQEFGSERAVLYGSGTDALQVALHVALRTVRDSAIALPAFSCFDVATAAVATRGRLRFYDVDPSTLGPDMGSLERVLARGTRIVIISPLYGFPVDWEAIANLLARHGALPVEDAAQGAHASWKGRPLGSLGPVSVLSFGRGKGWTGGSGGALLFRDQSPWDGLQPALAEVTVGDGSSVPDLRVRGLLVAQWALGRPAWYGIPRALPWLRLGETVYRDPTPPRPMTGTAAACIAASRDAAEREGGTRRIAAAAILDAVGSGSRVRAVRPIPGATPGYLRLPLRLADGLGGFERPMEAIRLGLAPSYPSVLPALPPVRPWVDEATSHWPGAEELTRTLFTAPTHSLVTRGEQAKLISLLEAYERRGS